MSDVEKVTPEQIAVAVEGAFQMAVGDLHSAERGSGARANGGKPPFELIPMSLIAVSAEDAGRSDIASVLFELAQFQARTKCARAALFDALILAVRLAGGWAACAWVFEYGLSKYAPWNWAKGMKWSIPIACIGRHAERMYLQREELDAESGRPHWGHIVCNMVMLCIYIDTYPEGDDRPTAGILMLESGA